MELDKEPEFDCLEGFFTNDSWRSRLPCIMPLRHLVPVSFTDKVRRAT